jgi:pimeloyl-ACP methyl ester carboxylesterase
MKCCPHILVSLRRNIINYGLLVLICSHPFAAMAQETMPLSISMENYSYPQRVALLPLTIEGQDLRMAYMDIPPEGNPNGMTVLLLHGKNFFGAYWKGTIRFLSQNGFRVIVPDQIGFGKSSKPNIHYSFNLLAINTKKVVDSLGITQVAVVGHSMGGMLATRFTLMYPETVTHLILENPIGLEDYRIYVPYTPIEEAYRNELNATEEGIDEYVHVFLRWKASGEYPRLAMSSALTSQMIYEQPVCYEFPYIRSKTLLVIGQSDRTVVGKAKVKKELLSLVGQYPELGRTTAKLIANSSLIELPDVGHIPHLEAPDLFHKELLKFLKAN